MHHRETRRQLQGKAQRHLSGLEFLERREYLAADFSPKTVGDYNLSGRIDLADFGYFKDRFGDPAAASDADLTQDGKVDLNDFGVVKQVFGMSVDDALTALGRNHPPREIILSVDSVWEGEPGAVLGSVVVSDLDVDDSHSLTVSDPRFEITGSVLALKPGATLDYETDESVSLSITATDSGGLSIMEDLIIHVVDRNEPPDVDQYPDSVVPLNRSVTLAAPRDPDRKDLTVHLALSGPGATVTLNEAGDRLIVTPGQDFAGSVTVTVTATDQEFTVERTFSVRFGEYDDWAWEVMTTPLADGGFLDSYGFLLYKDYRSDQPTLTDTGDAVIFTGLAATISALRGDNAKTLAFLTTLMDHGWRNGDPIRHPEEFYYTKDGERIPDFYRPLSHDGFTTVLAACYYAYTSPLSSDAVRDKAHSLVGRFIDYFVANQWRMHSAYGSDFIAKELYKPNGEPEDKGPDTWMLWPHERYALKNAAAEMGFITSHWQILTPVIVPAPPESMLGQVLLQVMQPPYNQIAADYVAHYFGEHVDTLLKNLKLSIPYSIDLGGGYVPNMDIHGSLDLELSDSDRDNIVSGIRTAIREGVRTGNLASMQLLEVVGQGVNRALGGLSDLIGADKWTALITGSLQQVMPWLDGSVVIEVYTYYVTYEALQHAQGGQEDPDDFFISHMTFWPTLMMMESRPEMVSFLGPFVTDFYRSIERHDMGLFAWMAHDGSKVDDLLTEFRTDAIIDAFGYRWQVSEKQQGDWRSERHASERQHRADYLILDLLKKRGTPPTVGDIGAEWLNRWRDALSDVVDAAIAQLLTARDDALSGIRSFLGELQNAWDGWVRAVPAVGSEWDHWRDRVAALGDNGVAAWSAWRRDQELALQSWYRQDVASVSDWMDDVRDRGRRSLRDLGLLDQFDEISSSFGLIGAEGFRKATDDFAGNLSDSAGKVVGGIVNAVKDAHERVADGARQAAGDIADWVKEALDDGRALLDDLYAEYRRRLSEVESAADTARALYDEGRNAITQEALAAKDRLAREFGDFESKVRELWQEAQTSVPSLTGISLDSVLGGQPLETAIEELLQSSLPNVLELVREWARHDLWVRPEEKSAELKSALLGVSGDVLSSGPGSLPLPLGLGPAPGHGEGWTAGLPRPGAGPTRSNLDLPTDRPPLWVLATLEDRPDHGGQRPLFGGGPGEVPIVGDWDGNGDDDIGVYLPNGGPSGSNWAINIVHLDNPNRDQYYVQFGGGPDEVPLVGDWDGDGDDDIGVYRPNLDQKWVLAILNGRDVVTTHQPMFGGGPGEVPIVGDWDGDGDDDIGLYLPNGNGNGQSWVLNIVDVGDASRNQYYLDFGGGSDELPLVGDWDGDGDDDVGLYRPNYDQKWILATLTGREVDATKHRPDFGGGPGERPVVGDWNGDGADDVGVYIANAAKGESSWVLNVVHIGDPTRDQFDPGLGGGPDEAPLVGDWDGDGDDGIGVYRPYIEEE